MINLIIINYLICKSRMKVLFCYFDYENIFLGDKGELKNIFYKDWGEKKRRQLQRLGNAQK